MNHVLSGFLNVGSRVARPTTATAGLAVVTFVVSTLFVATPAQGQDGFIRARINRTSPTSFHVQAGRDQGLDEHDIVDAFSDTAYVGSLRIVDVSEGAAELAFVRDDLMGQQQRRPTLTAGDYVYLRFAVGEAGLGRTRRHVRMPSFLDVDLQLGSAFDSNIDHNDDPVESYGLVPAARMRIRSSSDDPLLTAVYVVARHNYSNTDRWTRTSHLANVGLERKLSDWFGLSTTGQVSIRGSSEDRDLANQYRLEQDVEFRFSRQHRLIVYGGLVWKRFPESPIDDAFKPRLGAEFRRYGTGGRRWELDVRREANEEEEVRGEYDRWKVASAYRFPLGKTVLAQIGVEFRRKTYRERFVEIENDDYLRRDHRWTLGASATKVVGQRFSVELGYRFESRDSNDPDKLYNAHLVTLMMGYRLLTAR